MAITLYALKPRFQGLLRPLVGRCASAGLTANQVTVLAAAMSVATGAFVTLEAAAIWPFLLLPVAFVLRMAMNAVDGMLAREFGQASPLGAYLNELADVVSDIALYVPFAFVAPFGPVSVGLVIAVSCVSELAGALGPMVGATRRHDGPMGKSDRALVFGVLGLHVGLGGVLPDVAWWLMPALLLLIACSIVTRVRRGHCKAHHPRTTQPRNAHHRGHRVGRRVSERMPAVAKREATPALRRPW